MLSIRSEMRGKHKMKKFIFSLGRMRDYKKQLLESEKNKLIRLQTDLDSAVRMIQSLQNDYESIHREMTAEIVKGVTAIELKMFEYRKESIRFEQGQLSKQANQLENAVEMQRKNVVRMSQEISGLDKLEERQRTEYNRLVKKEDELIISEFIASRFIRQAAMASAE